MEEISGMALDKFGVILLVSTSERRELLESRAT